MAETKVARRYAKSLLDLAKEKGEIEAVNNDMKLLAEVCNSNHDLRLLLGSPIISNDKKLAILKRVFSGKISALSMSFFDVISRKGRESHLESIAVEFTRLYKEHKGIQTAIVTSAVGLDEKLRDQVYKMIKESLNSEIELIEKVDKDLIGGFILRVGDKQYDASISRDLRLMRQELIDTSYIRKN
jgi:F-type H+-transporting ATPase subunit delta